MKKVIIMLMLLAPLTAFAQKFGKVNTQTVVQTMTDYGKAQGELQALQKQKENELKGLQDELQRKSEEYEKIKSTLNATKQKETELELQNMYTKVQQAYQDGQQELQKKSQELMAPIQTRIINAIQAVGKAGNFTYIFEEGAAVYTGTNVEDITSKVQAQLR